MRLDGEVVLTTTEVIAGRMRELVRHDFRGSDFEWAYAESAARAALNAVLPRLMSEAWEDGYDEGDGDRNLKQNGLMEETARTPNPHKLPARPTATEAITIAHPRRANR